MYLYNSKKMLFFYCYGGNSWVEISYPPAFYPFILHITAMTVK